MAAALRKVRPVHASGCYFDQHFIGGRGGQLTFAFNQYIGLSSFSHFDNGHLSWQGHKRSSKGVN
jgi:hypothetical protein